jgi:hypothetical protein
VGKGASRELSQAEDVEVPLNEALSARLDAALERLDAIEPKFKAARDEERFAQSSKLWHRACAEMDVHLRTVAKVLIRTHQLNFDVGSEGGGVKASPWIEEMGSVFPRLYFRLDGFQVLAVSDGRTLATIRLQNLAYEFVEQAVVEWVAASVDDRA